MIQVKLGSTFSGLADAGTIYEVEASNIIQMLRALESAYPSLAPVLERGVAVAIDGQLHADDWLHPVTEGAEVILLPKVAGG